MEKAIVRTQNRRCAEQRVISVLSKCRNESNAGVILARKKQQQNQTTNGSSAAIKRAVISDHRGRSKKPTVPALGSSQHSAEVSYGNASPLQ